MANVTIDLTTHQTRLVESLVGSGRYQDAGEVMREALRLLEAREAREAAQLLALQEAARSGFADLDEGRSRDLQEAELEAFVASLGNRAAKQVSPAGP